MPATSTLHVTPEGDSWAVRLDEAAAPTSVHPTRGLAIATAFEMVEDRDEGVVIIHGKNGPGQTTRTLTIRQVGPPMEVLQTSGRASDLDDDDDPADRAEALRITPSNDRLRAMIGKFPLPPGDYENEELPC